MIKSTEIDPGIKAKAIERRFITLTYDISNGSLRSHIARKLLVHGFARMNLSVWYGIYSEALLQEIRDYITMWRAKYEKRGELIDIWILTPNHVGDESQFVLDKFEESFRAQWDHVDKVFLRVSKILDIDKVPGHFVELVDESDSKTKKIWQLDAAAFEQLYGYSLDIAKEEGYIYHDRTDDTYKAYRGDQVFTMVKDIQYCIQDLRQSLASRRKYEMDTATPEQIHNFDVLDQRLERDDEYLNTLSDRCAKRTVREGRDRRGQEPGQTTIDQSENKGFTEE
jgi:CRISPR/Cas system-associated endoribonuclease Cas2